MPEEYAVEYVVDRVDTVSTVFLGLTMGCARCHNHKYDPFTQKEYYQLYAYFNSIPEDGRFSNFGNAAPWMPAPTRAAAATSGGSDTEIAAARKSSWLPRCSRRAGAAAVGEIAHGFSYAAMVSHRRLVLHQPFEQDATSACSLRYAVGQLRRKTHGGRAAKAA